MQINSIERNIRFSNLALEDYKSLNDHYNIKLLESLRNEPNFISVYEASNNYIKPKGELKREAEKLSNNKEKPIADFGKAVLAFLAKGVRALDRLCLTIGVVLTVGGITLAVCIGLIIGILLFAVLVIPAAVLCKALMKLDKSLTKVIKGSKDENVKKYETVSKNIQKNKDGIKDIKDLEKLIKVSEAMEIVKGEPEMLQLTESLDLIRLINVIESKIDNYESSDICEIKMEVFEDLSPEHLSYNVSESSNIMESTNIDNTDLFMTLENINSQPLLSGKGLLNGMVAIATEACSEKSILEFLNRYKNTVLYEMKNEKYRDLPIMMETGLCLKYIRERCSDLPDVMESCNQMDQLFGDIITECETSVAEDGTGFNPDPFSIGSLTPLPVADRAVGNAVCDVLDAETDEEIYEAMINLSKISRAINESYYVTESGMIILREDAGKVARNAETKVNKEMSKVATKDKTDGVRAAAKRATDPMVAFIDKEYKKLKTADTNERRRIILQGGSITKVLYKVWRWVKRGIGLAAGAFVGAHFAPAAIATGIAFVGFIASDKYLDKKERAKILKELEDEIQICNEKIDDSRGDDNKQKKYELMRIRNDLQRQRDKIRYNLSN